MSLKAIRRLQVEFRYQTSDIMFFINHICKKIPYDVLLMLTKLTENGNGNGNLLTIQDVTNTNLIIYHWIKTTITTSNQILSSSFMISVN